MHLYSACQHLLATSTASPRKLLDYNYWIADLLGRYEIMANMEVLTTAELLKYVSDMRERGNSPATIYAKVSLINCVFDAARSTGWQGTKPCIPYPKVPRKLKWWPTPSIQERVRQWCIENSETDLLDFLDWTLATGLRVEETLRLTIAHFEGLLTPHKAEVLVPGLKTDNAQAMLAIGEASRLLAVRRLAQESPSPSENASQLFPCGYRMLARAWRRCRKALGISLSSATLKAWRRGFARTMTGRGCPLPVLQQMLRHGSPATTMEYLRLVGGGYTAEEQRRYL